MPRLLQALPLEPIWPMNHHPIEVSCEAFLSARDVISCGEVHTVRETKRPLYLKDFQRIL